ncbi:MAG TPA: DUF2510 domain-containing protein [Pseudolysinimonas sp.]|jgi:hypothetical protein
MAQPSPIAGWYPDPEHRGHDRWWDGAGWTDNRRTTGDDGAPTVAPAPMTAAATGPVGAQGSGLYIPGESVMQPAAYAATPVVRNNMALIGFILSLSGLILPFVINSFAGGIVSIIGLRRSKNLAGTGVFSNGRGIAIAGILVGFIWGGVLLLIVAGFIVFELWILGIVSNVQYSDSPVI